MEYATWVAGINGLGNRNDGDAIFFPQVFSQFNRTTTGTGKAVEQVHENVCYLFILAGIIQHTLELFTPIRFCTFIYTTKIFQQFKILTGCVFFNGFTLPL
ncbi:hypothetical protein PDL71_10665 [Lacibacter sp. MH-610]|nr:hypothetical protein [Chitinophagales bacterium]